jgi:hypothetical protein
MPAPTSAALGGPASGECTVVSAEFTVALDHAAGAGGVVVTVSDSVGGDTITSSPFTIPVGATTGTFTITPTTCGNRDISITTTPALTIIGSPATYNSLCNCPDDTGANSRVQDWNSTDVVCPLSFSVHVGVTPSTLYARTLYCTSSAINMTITE